MADGRKVQYLIELMPDTKQFEKIRQKIKAIDGGEFIKFEPSEVKKLKGILQGVVDDVGNRASSIGTKIQQGIANGLDKDKLQKMLDIDTTKLRETMEIVEKLTGLIDDHSKGSSWLKDGKGFLGKLSSSQQDLTNLEKSISKLELKFEGLDASLTSTIAKFDALANAIRSLQSGGNSVVAPSFKFANVSKDVDEVQRKIDKLNDSIANVDIKITSDSNTKEVYNEVERIVKKISTAKEKIEELQWDIDDPDISRDNEKKALLEQANEVEKLGELYKQLNKIKEVTPRKFADSLTGLGERLDPKNELGETISKLNSIKTILSETVGSSAVGQTQQIGIEIALPTTEDIRKQLNSAIDQLNKPNSLHKVKLEIDDVANIIKDKQKRAYGDNPADDDKNTTELVQKTETRFQRIADAIDGKQKQILKATTDWRGEMLDLLKFDKEAFSFKFDTNLIQQLETLFEDYELPIRINTEDLASQIKTVLEDGSLSIGGGTANINPNAIAQAVKAGILAAFVGGEMPAVITPTASEEVVVDETDKIATDITDTAKHLDLAEDYVKDVVEKLKAVAAYATKHIGTDKDGRGAISTRELFSRVGGVVKDESGKPVKDENDKTIPILDLTTIKDKNDEDVVKIIEQALLSINEFGDLNGSTLIDELSKFKGSSSKTISAFLQSISELFYMLQEDTLTVDELTRKQKSKEIFDSAREKANVARGLQTIRSSIRQGNAPDLTEIDDMTAIIAPYFENFAKRQLSYKGKEIEALAEQKRIADPALAKDFDKSLELARQEIYEKLLADVKAPFAKLRAARETLGDATDDASVQEFQSAAQDFYKGTAKLFYNLKKQAEDTFKGTVFVEGKNGRVAKSVEKYKDFAQVKDDAVIVDVQVHSSLNNVALDVARSKHSGRISRSEELRTMRGQSADYLTQKQYEEDILQRSLTYGGFKPQGAPTTEVDIDKSLEANQKRKEALLAEIQSKEQEKSSLESEIVALDEKIKELTEKNNKIPESRRTAAIEKVSNYETQQTQLSDDIFWGDQKIQQITANIEEQRQKRANAEQRLTQLSELDVERTKKGIQSRIEVEKKEESALQVQLQEQLKVRSALETNRVFEQAEVFKARSALKAIPDTKANQTIREEASNRVIEAEQRLEKAVKALNNVGKEINETNDAIEKKKTLIETLDRQMSETTLEIIRKEQENRIRAIDGVISGLESELTNAFSQQSSRKDNLRVTKLKLRNARNTVAFKTQGELDGAIATRENLTAKVDESISKSTENKAEIERIDLMNTRLAAEKEYNELREKSLMLQGSIVKLEQDGASEDVLSKKKKELDAINAKLSETEAKVKELGGFFGQRETKEYSDAERKSYALSHISSIDDDLITARAQKHVADSRLAQVDRKLAELEQWKLGAGVGARELESVKNTMRQEFKSSDAFKSFDEALIARIKTAKQEAEAHIAQMQNTHRDTFNEKVQEAMIREGMNPYSQKETNQFMNTQRGQQIAAKYEQWIAEDTEQIWQRYNDDVKRFREESRALQDKALEEFEERLVDGGLLDYETIRENFKKRLQDERAHRKAEYDPDKYQADIDRLMADRKTAIQYGGVSEKEIYSEKVIQDEIRKETDLATKKAEQVTLQTKLNELEAAGISEKDEAYKKTQKELTAVEKEISYLDYIIANRKQLVQMRWDEKQLDKATPEERQLLLTDNIVKANQSIERSLANQEELKEKIKSATGDEKTKLEYSLSKEEANVERLRKNIGKWEGRIGKISTVEEERKTKADVGTTAKVSGGLLGGIMAELKEFLAGSGGVSDEILQTISETASKILEVITSGGVKISVNSKVTSKGDTKDVTLEKKLARIRVLEAEKTASVNKSTWTSAMSEEERKASIATVNKYDKNTVNKWKDMGADELINVMQDITRSMDGLNKESVEYLAKQRELGRVLNVYKTKSPVTSEATVTKKNGKSYINSKILAENDEALKQLGLYDKYDPITSDLAVRNMFATSKNEGFTQKKEEELARLKQEIKEVNTVAKDNGGLRDAIPEETVEETDELTAKIERLKQKFEEAKKVGYIDKNDADLKAFESATDKNEALRYGDKVSAKVSKNRRAYSGTTEMNAATRQRSNIEARGILANDDLEKVKNYNDAYSDLIAKHRSFSTAGTLYDPENQKTLQNMAIKAKTLGKELEAAQTRSEDLRQKVDNSGLYNGKSIGDMSQVAQGTDLYEQMRAKLEELGATNIKIDRIHQRATGTIRHNDRLVSDLEVSYDELTNSLARYHRQERESLTGVPAFLNGFQKKFNSIMQYLSMTMSIHRIISEVRRGIQYVREIDDALVELRKVTDETAETYDKFLQTAAKTGERLGATISEVTKATSTFAKLGYTIEQSTIMAEAALVYKNVGDNIASTEDAADSIISTLKGFGLESSETMRIVDRFNEVGKCDCPCCIVIYN